MRNATFFFVLNRCRFAAPAQRVFVLGLWLLTLANRIMAQTPDPTIFQPVQPPKQIQAVRAVGSLTIDKRLDAHE